MESQGGRARQRSGAVPLGYSFRLGKGVAKDDKEAVKWFRKAAEQGLALAQFDLGECYLEGTGVDKDEKEAVKWFRKAAEQGLGEAETALRALHSHD